MNNPGYIIDIKHRLFLGKVPEPHGVGVAVTNWRRKIVGVYIDDTTPNIEYWVNRAAAAYPNGIVLVAKAPGQVHVHYDPKPPIVELQEWYPYHSGSDWPPIPKAEGYILQWRFTGFKGYRRPALRQRLRLLREARAHHPRYIFLY